MLESDTLELVVPAGRLEPTKSKATEQIAVLVSAGRQATGLDDGWTSVDHLRAMCEHYRRHDSNNFAATIKELDQVFVIRGAGRDRKVRMSAPGWQRAGEIVQTLVPADV